MNKTKLIVQKMEKFNDLYLRGKKVKYFKRRHKNYFGVGWDRLNICLTISYQLTHFEPTFLGLPASKWASDGNYKLFRELVNGFLPVNDAAERAVKFASDFNGRITTLACFRVLKCIAARMQNKLKSIFMLGFKFIICPFSHRIHQNFSSSFFLINLLNY